MTPKSLLQPLLAFCLLTASACTPFPILNPSLQNSSLQVSQVTGLSAYQAKQMALWQQFKNKPAYSGSLKMSIHTDLLNPGQGGRQIDLTNQLDPQGFQIQSVPQGPLVFQETFTKDKGNYEVIRGFQLTNTLQRYTLHVEAEGKKVEGQISVNINGTDWLKPDDFKDQEAEVNSLLLNANNSLRVRIQGKEGTSYTVSLIEGGEAGTVLRRRGNLRQEDENQARHIRQNDTNIFNPNNPNSLGGLTPYQGHLEGEDVPPVVTGVAVDDGLPLQFEAGTLILRLREPEVILPILQSKYGATVLDKLETPGYPEFTYYYLQFDLSKSPVNQVAQLIRAYRTKIPADFNEFVFASLSSLQTFTILMDLMVNYEPYIATWEFNTYKKPPMENLMPIKPVPNDLNQQNQNPVVSNNKGWWLRDTYVNEAWNLSLGTGVNVAYIDHGFKGIFNGTTPESEFGHRLLFKQPSLLDGFGLQNIVAERRKSEVIINSNNTLECQTINPDPTKNYYCGGDHGSTTAMAGFAQRNNTRGTVGVAPNANLVPYNTDRFMFTHVQALGSIFLAGGKIDVIGYNKQDQAPKSWTPIYTVPNDPGNDPYSKTMLKVFIALLNNVKKMPIVVAAGNDGSSCPSVKDKFGTIKKDCSYEFIPSSFDGQPSPLDPTQTISLIIAGGADRRNATPVASPSPLGAHNANSNKDITGWNGSVIGYNYVWAPATQIEVFDFSVDPNPVNAKINQKAGTSFSCPILTGVVALMKSRNPDLTPQEIKTILRNSPTRIDITHDSGVPSPLRLTNEPFIDAQYAVEEAIKKKTGSQPAQYVAKDYFALISDTAGKKTARLNRAILASAKPEDKEKTVLRSVADNVWSGALASGKLVKIKGWSNLTAGAVSNMVQNLEVLQAEEICPANACSNPIFKPQLDEVIYPDNPGAETGFELELKGQNLVADLRSGSTQPIKLIFIAKASLDTPPKPLPSPDPEVALSSSDILDISNDGTYVKVKIPANKIPSNFDYQLIFRSGITGNSNICPKYTLERTGTSRLSGFSVYAQGSSGTFSKKSLLSPPAGSNPADFSVTAFYDPNSNIPITARAGDTIGFFMANARTRNISIEIQGKNAVVKAISDDLISMTVPADLVVGNLNVLFKSDQGSFQIDNLLNYTSPYPEVVKFSKPTIFANGGDIVDAYITVKDQNGQPVPDGTPYYIHLMPTHIGLYPDLRMIDPETQQEYGGKWSSYEQVFTVKNGKVHFQVKLSEAIAPYTYTYDWANNIPNALTWPHAEAPSFQVQVCTPAYSSYKPGYGYYCGQQLFPQTGNTQDGRLYAVHAYSMDPQINYVTAGSGRQLYKIHNIKDILGNPVPVGTVLYLNNTYYGQISTTEGGDIARGAVVKTPGELEFAYEPISRVSCTWFAGTQDIAYITPNGASGDPLSWMIGSPIYFKYVLC